MYENVGCVFSRDGADVGEPKLSGQFFRETSQLPLIQKLAIDHSYNQLLHTALQPLDLDRETEESSWREALQKLKARGVEFIKVHNALSQETFFALADEFTNKACLFAVHLPRGIRVAEASDAGSLRDSSRTELGMFPRS
jgi:hypothetical protein